MTREVESLSAVTPLPPPTESTLPGRPGNLGGFGRSAGEAVTGDVAVVGRAGNAGGMEEAELEAVLDRVGLADDGAEAGLLAGAGFSNAARAAAKADPDGRAEPFVCDVASGRDGRVGSIGAWRLSGRSSMDKARGGGTAFDDELLPPRLRETGGVGAVFKLWLGTASLARSSRAEELDKGATSFRVAAGLLDAGGKGGLGLRAMLDAGPIRHCSAGRRITYTRSSPRPPRLVRHDGISKHLSDPSPPCRPTSRP